MNWGFAGWTIYWIGNLATFGKLMFFNGFNYNWWNWMLAIPLHEFLAAIWPIYWLILRPVFGH